MSISRPTDQAVGATADDCVRLWSTITTELIRDSRMEITPRCTPDGSGYIEVAVVSDSVHQVDGEAAVNVWATKEFHNKLHLISVGQLFDLLIVAYRVMDRYFERGDAFAPPRRVK